LVANGIADADTLAKLNTAGDFRIDPARANADIKTLVNLGSRTAIQAEIGKKLSAVLGVLGGGGLLDSIMKANGTGMFDGLITGLPNATANATQTSIVENALPILLKAIPALLDPAGGLPLIAVGIGYFMWQKYKNVAAARLQDHRQGLNQAR